MATAQLPSRSPERLEAHRRAARAEARIIRARFQPPPRMSILEWADEFRYLSTESSAEPGKYSSARAPYQREPMEVIGDPRVRRIVLMWASQLGKSLIIENAIGRAIHLRPGPILLLQPRVEDAEMWSKERFAPMVRDTPVLRDRVSEAKSRASGNTLRSKIFNGGHLALVGANAPAGLAARPIRDLYCDEVDRYDESAGTEGDPIDLAERRTATFGNATIVETSTPGDKGRSRIEPAYLAGDQREYHVPCPHCQQMQVLRWGSETSAFGLKWDAGHPETVAYLCEHCGCLIDELAKPWMLERGRWIPKAPGNPYPSFWLNALYSPFDGCTWAKLAANFLEVKHAPARLKTFINTILCETWEEPGEVVESHTLMTRLEHYPCACEENGTPDPDAGELAAVPVCTAPRVPTGVGALTMGVDVQGDRLELRVWGWGAGEVSWLLRMEQIPGDPGSTEPWEVLEAIRRVGLIHESGRRMPIARTFVDSGGHHTKQVYEYCRPRRLQGVFACKGIGGAGTPFLGQPNYQTNAKVMLYPVGTFAAKESFLRSRLYAPREKPGYVHLPDWVTLEELEQLTSEKLIRRIVAGQVKREWIKIRERNEALDCEVYAHAALHAMGAGILLNLGKWAEKIALPITDEEREKMKPLPDPEGGGSAPLARPARRRPKRSGGGFVDRWRN
jgi:phage terminase large subunit GpA-like protein